MCNTKQLFLVLQWAQEVPTLTQFIKVLMEDNCEQNYSKGIFFHALGEVGSFGSMFENSALLLFSALVPGNVPSDCMGMYRKVACTPLIFVYNAKLP